MCANLSLVWPSGGGEVVWPLRTCHLGLGGAEINLQPWYSLDQKNSPASGSFFAQVGWLSASLLEAEPDKGFMEGESSEGSRQAGEGTESSSTKMWFQVTVQHQPAPWEAPELESLPFGF